MGTRKTKEKSNKKVIIAILLLVVAVFMITRAAISYFSDYVAASTSATAGTLDLVAGTTTITREWTDEEGTKSETLASISNLNPGDIVTINTGVTNTGNKSAWVRDVISVEVTAGPNFYPGPTPPATVPTAMFEFYPATATTAEIKAGTGKLTTVITDNSGSAITNGVLTFTPTGASVINGVGTGAETETSTTAPSALTIIAGDTGTTGAYKMYFKAVAGNDYQALSLTFKVRTEAMQFRNNPSPVWSEVTTTEFSL